MYTGLPDFKSLVEDAFLACDRPLKSDDDGQLRSWDLAYKHKQYDKALDLLERNTNHGVMRREVLKRLSKPIPEPLLKGKGAYLHKALLDLARRPNGGYRLVTTNFDDRFQTAGLPIALAHDAPRLAPPRHGVWQHVTYLHGRIDEADPDGKHLILTTPDFGRAYLRDGWAARFVVELFREFTVLFVGYSVDDPVMAYLIAALAADHRQFRSAFALAGFSETKGDLEHQREIWEARNVELIPFSVGSRPKKDYTLLEDTLVEWARHYSGGLNTRIAETLRSTAKPYEQGDESSAKNVIWALSKDDGSVARAFAEEEPPPHISWLGPLSTIEVRSRSDEQASYVLTKCPAPVPRRSATDHRPGYHSAAIAGLSSQSQLTILAPVAFQLSRWLVKHLDRDELVTWIIEQHGSVHPQFARLIRHRLSKEPQISEPYLTFWNLVTDGLFEVPLDSLDPTSSVSSDLTNGISNHIVRRKLRSCCRPYLVPHPPFKLPPLYQSGPTPLTLRDLGRFELALSDVHELKDVLGALPGVSEFTQVAGLADEFTSVLLDAVRLSDAADINEVVHETYWSLPSIADHQQNNHAPDWTVLIQLARSAWEIEAGLDPHGAQLTLYKWMSLWKQTHYSIFSRLSLHAMTESGLLAGSECIAFILEGSEGSEPLLWSLDANRELLRFLRIKGGTLDEPSLTNLTEAILDGPPRALFRGDILDADFESLKERAIGLRLAKLASSSAALPDQVRSRAQSLISTSDRDEFLTWTGGAKWEAPPKADDLLALPPTAIAERLAGGNTSWERVGTLTDLARKNPQLLLETLMALAELGIARSDFWSAALMGLAERNNPSEQSDFTNRILRLLETFPNQVPAASDGIATWLHKVSAQ